MDHESPELIEQEMEATRASLTHKVAELEQQVLGTIQNASQTVNQIVETVKTVVPETLHTVKDTLTESVSEVSERMKSAFDLAQHTREHPWAMVGGATALGFVTGLLLFGRSSPSFSRLSASSPHPTAAPGSTMPPVTPASVSMPPGGTMHAATMPAGNGQHMPGWVDSLLNRMGFDHLIDRAAQELRGIAESALASASQSLRQTVEESVPRLLGPDALGVRESTCPPSTASGPTGPGSMGGMGPGRFGGMRS